MTREWECVVGLEVHIQLATRSKLFSGASTEFGAEPNTQACLIDAALPGVLPVCNREAVRMAVMFGIAVGADINRHSVFARKNYFYPDLPKGYQISQYELPIVLGGNIETDVGGKAETVHLTRAHLEEDAGKSLHDQVAGATGIDLNRAGTPLLEISIGTGNSIRGAGCRLLAKTAQSCNHFGHMRWESSGRVNAMRCERVYPQKRKQQARHSDGIEKH